MTFHALFTPSPYDWAEKECLLQALLNSVYAVCNIDALLALFSSFILKNSPQDLLVGYLKRQSPVLGDSSRP
jgi:hypothetical protein